MDAPATRKTGFSRAFAAMVAGTRLRAALALVIVSVLSTVAGLYGRGVKVDTNLEALLARTSPSVKALDELRARQGSTDLLDIPVRSSDPEANRRLAADIAARLSAWPEVLEVTTERDFTPLRDRALYFLDHDDLIKLRDRLKRERQRAIARRMGLGDSQFDERVLDTDDWDEDPEEQDAEADEPAKTKPKAPVDALPNDGSGDGSLADDESDLRRLLDDQKQKLLEGGRIKQRDLDLIWPVENDKGELLLPDKVARSTASADGTIALVQARLSKPPTDVAFSTGITAKVEALFTELELTSYAPDMLAKVAGSYSGSTEASTILVDLNRATWLSAALVTASLIVGFRTFRGIAIALLPLACGIFITVAAARWVLGSINVLTAFLFAVLLGIGVDFAIHLYAQREQQGPTADWGAIFREHTRPLLMAAATTVGSFLVLLFADFRGFQEFGEIAAIGVTIALACAFVMVPAIDTLAGPLTRSAKIGEVDQAALGPYRRPTLRRLLLLAVVIIGTFGALRVSFERDMRNLRAPKTEGEKGIAYAKALADTQPTGTPVAILADSTEQLDQAVEILRAHNTDKNEGMKDPWIREVVSLAANLPKDQEAKQPLLKEIANLARGFHAEIPTLRTDDPARKYATHLSALAKLGSTPPIDDASIPEWAKSLFREKTGEIGRIGLLYVDIYDYDLEEVVWITERFRELVAPTGVRGASTRFILADLTMEVESDFKRLPPYALGVILLLLVIDLKAFRPTIATFASLCGGILLTFGVMGIAAIRINFYNLVVMPAVIGLGIDASIHLWHSRKHGAIGATSKGAIYSALTTAGAFAGLLVARHAGLRSIGTLGVVATLCGVAVAIVALGWPRKPSA